MFEYRYPSFVDALRDLDDALSMIFLFATLPTNDKIALQHVQTCQRLSAEFQHYVMQSRCMQKVFLSIKGIYYQAEIKGQTVTWIAPYSFSQNVPTDVDFKVMATFLEFYETLIGFVNYKLYTEMNLVYPPKLNSELDQQGADVDAYIVEVQKTTDESLVNNLVEKQPMDISDGADKKEMKDRLETLKNKLTTLDEQESELMDEEESENEVEDSLMEDIPQPIAEAQTSDESLPSLLTWLTQQKDLSAFQSLFSKCVFFLNREVPRASLSFVIRSFGGKVGWDETVAAGSSFGPQDPRITHHIVDRPLTSENMASLASTPREFLQPQWVYDCINARKLVKTSGYHPSESLPPHLSPFVEYAEGDYIPEAAAEVAKSAIDGEDDEETLINTEIIEDEEEKAHQKESEAEVQGMSFTAYSESKLISEEDESISIKQKKDAVKEAKEKKEQKDLAKIMMTKKDKYLYHRIQHGKQKKADQVEALKKKKAKLARDQKKKTQ